MYAFSLEWNFVSTQQMVTTLCYLLSCLLYFKKRVILQYICGAS